MSQIVGVSPVYYNLTHRIVGQLKDRGLVKIAKATNIPLRDLKEFAENKELDGAYMPALYSHLFETKTFLQAQIEMDEAGW